MDFVRWNNVNIGIHCHYWTLSFCTWWCPLWHPNAAMLSYELKVEYCGVLKTLGSEPGLCYSTACMVECSGWSPVAGNYSSLMLSRIMMWCEALASGGWILWYNWTALRNREVLLNSFTPWQFLFNCSVLIVKSTVVLPLVNTHIYTHVYTYTNIYTHAYTHTHKQTHLSLTASEQSGLSISPWDQLHTVI